SEDGTIDFWGIAALKRGFEDIGRYGGIRAIQQKTHALAYAAYQILMELKFPSGKPLAEVYCCHKNYSESEAQGPIVAFNLLRCDGSYTGYSEVEKMCDLFGIEVRTGCFCNQGACQKHLKLTQQQIIDNYKASIICYNGAV
ncbi:unnamed protein product, partial [Gongylonema pulchrum]|uniref:Aminotran_5 domain-containing protein n=1 Tax=Gongylonema pulchrum TaxID=637853 RepID=A0A183EC25_9BILA